MTIVLGSVLALGNISGVVVTSSMLTLAIFGGETLFTTGLGYAAFANTREILVLLLQPTLSLDVILVTHRMLILLYCLPMLLLICFIIHKILREARAPAATEMVGGEAGKSKLKARLTRICKYAGIPTPEIRVSESSMFEAEAAWAGMHRSVLFISQGALKALQGCDDELEALLAHEAFHLKRHGPLRKLLCLLSDFSLLGNGFLVLVQNSFQVEKEADEFATNWLKRTGRPVEALVNLLELQEETNAMQSALGVDLESSGSFKLGALRYSASRKRLLDTYSKVSWTKRLQLQTRLLYQMYFGSEILSYFHPPVSQRIAWIRNEEA